MNQIFFILSFFVFSVLFSGCGKSVGTGTVTEQHLPHIPDAPDDHGKTITFQSYCASLNAYSSTATDFKTKITGCWKLSTVGGSTIPISYGNGGFLFDCGRATSHTCGTRSLNVIPGADTDADALLNSNGLDPTFKYIPATSSDTEDKLSLFSHGFTEIFVRDDGTNIIALDYQQNPGYNCTFSLPK